MLRYALLLMLLIPTAASARNFTFINQCQQTVWVGALGNQQVGYGGWALLPRQQNQFNIPENWSGRFWGRTVCDFKHNPACETGDCGDKLQCNGAGGKPPASLIELTLGNMDFYDVSLVDGYNLPVKIAPSAKQTGPYSCGAPTCVADLNLTCPPDLQVIKDGEVVACMSACEKFDTDQYCCRGDYGTPDKCKPTAYSQIFKNACPNAYSYAYDDKTSTYTCSGAPQYTVTFCPGDVMKPTEPKFISASAVPPTAPLVIPTPTPAPMPVAKTPTKHINNSVITAEDYIVSIGYANGNVSFSFLPTKALKNVTIHYLVDQGEQQDFNMQPTANGAWTYVLGKVHGSLVSFSFSYAGNFSHKSPWYGYSTGATGNVRLVKPLAKLMLKHPGKGKAKHKAKHAQDYESVD